MPRVVASYKKKEKKRVGGYLNFGLSEFGGLPAEYSLWRGMHHFLFKIMWLLLAAHNHIFIETRRLQKLDIMDNGGSMLASAAAVGTS